MPDADEPLPPAQPLASEPVDHLPFPPGAIVEKDEAPPASSDPATEPPLPSGVVPEAAEALTAPVDPFASTSLPPGTLPEAAPAEIPAVPPAPARRRRFDPLPGTAGNIPASVWRRHWCGVGGFVLLSACVYALIGSPGPDWHWTGRPTDRPPTIAGAVAVVVDPGHGGGDSGAVSQGVVEKDLNLDVGRRVAQNLSARGVKVLLTREDDHFITLEERVRTGNAQPGAVFVSIHFNDASGDGRVAMNRASGIETFYSENKAMSASAGGWMWASLFGAGARADPVAAHEVELWSAREGAALAQSIQGALVASTAAADRGIKERSLYVTRRVRGPSVLVEGGFVSHPAEARLLGDPSYRQKLADAIADGIVRYLEAAARQPVPAAVLASLGA